MEPARFYRLSKLSGANSYAGFPGNREGYILSEHASLEDLNRGPKNQIVTDKLRALGMTFGGEPLLRQTVAELIEAHRGRGRG